MADKRSYADRAEYLKHAVAKRRRVLKRRSVNYLGGECSLCGYNKCIDALDFHHVNPKDKSFGLSASGMTRSWIRIQEELDKCILLCANCHRELHSDNSSFNE